MVIIPCKYCNKSWNGEREGLECPGRFINMRRCHLQARKCRSTTSRASWPDSRLKLRCRGMQDCQLRNMPWVLPAEKGEEKRKENIRESQSL